MIKTMMRMVSKGFDLLTEGVTWIGYAALAAIVLTIFVNVFARYVLHNPLRGIYEIVLSAMIVLGGSAIMYTAIERGHVAVDLLFTRFSRRKQIAMHIVISLLGAGTWGLLAYQGYLRAMVALKNSVITDALSIPTGPFLLVLAFAGFLCSLILLIQAFHPEASKEKQGEK